MKEVEEGRWSFRAGELQDWTALRDGGGSDEHQR